MNKKNFLTNLKRVHCVGIGGIGVSAVAKLLQAKGIVVTGYDATRSLITEGVESLGIRVAYGADPSLVEPGVDLLIYSSAVPANHRERVAARNLKIKELSYFAFLGNLSKEYETIAVAGTHGKSTTTAMLGLILESAGLDPTVIVGSLVKTFPHGNLRLGQSKILVVEACEYEEHFLELSPQAIIVTNIEADHLDYFKDFEHIKRAFLKFINRLPDDGRLVLNSDDAGINDLEITRDMFITRFGIKNKATYQAKPISPNSGVTSFTLVNWTAKGPRELGQIDLKIPGVHNVANALGAASMALVLGVEFKILKKALEDFQGIWRRFERVGEYRGATIISDYGHHPTAVRETIQAARDFFKERRVVLVFQPHQRNRTKKLFTEFASNLATADLTIVSDIYDVTGRESLEDQDVSSERLVETMKLSHPERANQFIWSGTTENTKALIETLIKPNDLVIIMGAGDIYRVANELVHEQ